MVTPEKIRQTREGSANGQMEKTEHSQKQYMQGWQSKDNPSSIGSSKAFKDSTKIVPPLHQKEVHMINKVSHGTDFEEVQTERQSIDVPVTHNEQPADHIDAQVEVIFMLFLLIHHVVY